MPKLIYRSIVLEIAPYLLISLALLTVIIFASQAGEFSELFVKKNVPPTLVRTLLLSLIPRILILTVPISLLIATMTALGRMAGDYETVALFASGMSRRQVLAPALGLALAASSLLFYLTAVDMPRAARRFKAIRAQLILQGIRTQVKPRVFDDRFVNKVLYIDEINRRTDTWDRIFLALTEEAREPGNREAREHTGVISSAPQLLSPSVPQLLFVTARRGSLELGESPGQSQLSLSDGVIHKRTIANGKSHYDVEAFSQSQVRFDATSKEARTFGAEREASTSPRARVLEMTLSELYKEPGHSDLGKRAKVELHRRLAISLSPLVFAVLGVALVITQAGVGRGAGLSIAIFSASVYYLLFLGGENLARSGRLSPALGLWAANVLFTGLALLRLRSRHWTSRLRVVTAWRTALGAWRSRLQAPSQGLLLRIRLAIRHPSSAIRHRRLPHSSSWPLLVDRHLAKSFLSFFLMILTGLWALFLIFTALELSSDIASNKIAFSTLASYLLYLSPLVLSYLAPPSALIATLVSISILGRTGELTALRAAGFSIYRISAPLVVVCLLISLSALAWQQIVVPTTNTKQEELRFYIKKGRLPSYGELAMTDSGTNWISSITGEPTAQPNRGGRIFHFRSFDRQTNQLTHPIVLELRPSDFTISRRIEARQAEWDGSHSAWVFSRGFIREFDGGRLLSEEQFEQFPLHLEEGPDYFKREPKKPDSMDFRELNQAIRRLETSGLDATEMKVALERKKAGAAACFVMGLFGIPFGLTFGRKGALQAIGVGVFGGLVFWLAIDLFAQMGRYGYFSPAVAAWSPNALLTAAGTYLLFRAKT